MSAFDDIRTIAPNVIWPGVVGRSLHGANATLAHIELEPNADVPEHQHVNEQIGILVKGSLRFTIGGEAKDIEPGAGWVIRANVPHSVLVGPDGATIYEMFAPPRTDWAGQERLEPRVPDGF
jgi:quercetin dioxygenase-like cupin family protein